MKWKIPWMLSCMASLALIGQVKAAETNIFQWTTRPRLTPEQERLLRLQKNMQILVPDSPLHAEQQAEMAALQKKLGPLTVRGAKPNELIMSVVNSNVCRIYNPTTDGLVLTVSIVGDVEQLGSRMASMGREAYFPPRATLVVSNLYWTTPATAKK